MGNFIGVRRCLLIQGSDRAAFERDLEALTAYFRQYEPGLQHFSWSRKASDGTQPDYLTLEIWVDADAHRRSGQRRRGWARGEGTPTPEFTAMYPALERIRAVTDNAPVEWFDQAD
jgi:hypothetical protein